MSICHPEGHAVPDHRFAEVFTTARTLWIVDLLSPDSPPPRATLSFPPLLAMLSYVLMTNGGGALEHVKAAAVSSVLGLHVPESAVIVAHTPMRVSCSPMLAQSSAEPSHVLS
jgi:hypothetical protein